MKKRTLVIKDKMLSGSVTTANAKCGNKSCKCQKSKKDWHGPYYRWTGFINGKRTTVTLAKNQIDQCIIRIKNYQNLKKQIEDFLIEDMKIPPWLRHN